MMKSLSELEKSLDYAIECWLSHKENGDSSLTYAWYCLAALRYKHLMEKK